MFFIISTEPNLGMIIGSVVGGMGGIFLLSFAVAFGVKKYSSLALARPGQVIAPEATEMQETTA